MLESRVLDLKAVDAGEAFTCEPKLNYWQYSANPATSIPFVCLPQFFELDMTVHRPQDELDSKIERNLDLHVRWMGLKSGKDATVASNWDTIAAENVTRVLDCNSGAGSCDPLLVFRTNSVQYSLYYFEVQLPGDQDLSTIDTVDFMFRYRNAAFAQLELGVKLTLCVTTLMVGLTYVYAQSAVNADGRRGSAFCGLCLDPSATADSAFSLNWIALLLVLLFLYNNPVFILEFYTPRAFFAFIQLGFQVTFMAALMTFLLGEFGILAAEQPERLTFCGFFLPKIVLMFVYWLLAVSFYGWVIFRQQQDPLYDWTEDGAVLVFLEVLGLLMASLYGLYVVVLLACSTKNVCDGRTDGERAVFALHVFILAATIAGLGVGAVYQFDVDHALDFMFFHVLFNAYVYTIAYVYAPVRADYHLAGGGDGVQDWGVTGVTSAVDGEGDIEMGGAAAIGAGASAASAAGGGAAAAAPAAAPGAGYDDRQLVVGLGGESDEEDAAALEEEERDDVEAGAGAGAGAVGGAGAADEGEVEVEVGDLEGQQEEADLDLGGDGEDEDEEDEDEDDDVFMEEGAGAADEGEEQEQGDGGGEDEGGSGAGAGGQVREEGQHQGSDEGGAGEGGEEDDEEEEEEEEEHGVEGLGEDDVGAGAAAGEATDEGLGEDWLED